MENSNKYDAIGELFRQKLENHRLLVDADSWDEIESRLAKPKNKAIIWLWSYGAMAAAATIAAMLIINGLTPDEAPVMEVSLQVASNEIQEAIPTETIQIDILKPADEPVNRPIAVFQPPVTGVAELIVEPTVLLEWESNEIQNSEIAIVEQEEILIAEVEQNWEIPKPNIIFVDDKTDKRRERKWLLAAAFGTGGGLSEGFSNQPANGTTSADPAKFVSLDSKSAGNQYAANMSANIQSFRYLNRNDFTNISHVPPLSFALMAHRSGEEGVGVEFGLIYTYLESHFERQGNNTYQKLYYMGIPFNLVIYLWNSNPEWRIYLSGGFTAEKGLRAIYQQDERWGGVIRTTHVKHSINGLQWSANGALGVNYRFEKPFGIYLESRFGHSFDNNQPISIRTERPFFVGVAMGLSYEL